MTIFDVLARDHESLRALLSKVDEVAAGMSLEALFHEIRIEVLVHTRAEEDTFYAALEAIDATEALADRAVDEHEVVEALLALLDTVDVGSVDWHATFGRMRALLLQHIAAEEGGLFDAARAVLDAAAQQRLAGAFQTERQRLLDDGTSVVGAHERLRTSRPI
jgi:hypothetical protein